MTLDELFEQNQPKRVYDCSANQNSKCSSNTVNGHCGGAGSNAPDCVNSANPTHC